MAIGSGNIMLLDGTKQCWLLAGDVLWYLPQSPGENNFTADGQIIIPIQWVWKLYSPWANALINIKILEKHLLLNGTLGLYLLNRQLLTYCKHICRTEYVFHVSLSKTWWRHQMETFSALLALCAGNSPVPGEFPSQRPVTRSFDVFFDLRRNKR